MFTYSLGSIENPINHIAISEYFFVILKGHIDYKLVSEKLNSLICDPYKIREFSFKEISLISNILEESDLSLDLDEEVSVLLIKLKEMFARAKRESLIIYGVGD